MPLRRDFNALPHGSRIPHAVPACCWQISVATVRDRHSAGQERDRCRHNAKRPPKQGTAATRHRASRKRKRNQTSEGFVGTNQKILSTRSPSPKPRRFASPPLCAIAIVCAWVAIGGENPTVVQINPKSRCRANAIQTDPPAYPLTPAQRERWWGAVQINRDRGWLRWEAVVLAEVLLTMLPADGRLWPSLTLLGDRLGEHVGRPVSPWVVRTCVDQLVACGAVERHPRRALADWPGGAPGAKQWVQSSNAYTLHLADRPLTCAPPRRRACDVAKPPVPVTELQSLWEDIASRSLRASEIAAAVPETTPDDPNRDREPEQNAEEKQGDEHEHHDASTSVPRIPGLRPESDRRAGRPADALPQGRPDGLRRAADRDRWPPDRSR